MRGILIGVAVCTVLAGCSSTPKTLPTTIAQTSSTSTRPSTTAVAAPTSTYQAPAQSADELTEQYLIALRARGFQITDEDDAWLAGSGFCALLPDEGLINATAETMDTYELTPDQAKQVAGAAQEAICPPKKGAFG